MHAGYVPATVAQAVFRKSKGVQATGLHYPKFKAALTETAALAGASLADALFSLNEAAAAADALGGALPPAASCSTIEVVPWDDSLSLSPNAATAAAVAGGRHAGGRQGPPPPVSVRASLPPIIVSTSSPTTSGAVGERSSDSLPAPHVQPSHDGPRRQVNGVRNEAGCTRRLGVPFRQPASTAHAASPRGTPETGEQGGGVCPSDSLPAPHALPPKETGERGVQGGGVRKGFTPGRQNVMISRAQVTPVHSPDAEVSIFLSHTAGAKCQGPSVTAITRGGHHGQGEQGI